ncbi:hypothetical protein ScPMuIL_005858 [Solemya velum]
MSSKGTHLHRSSLSGVTTLGLAETKLDPGAAGLSSTEHLTRSSAKQSDGHRQMVNFLEKLSKDENGTPVDWSFLKSKKIKGKAKRITSYKKNVEHAPWLKNILGNRKTSRKEQIQKQKDIKAHIIKNKRKLSAKKLKMVNLEHVEQETVAREDVAKKKPRPKRLMNPRKPPTKSHLTVQSSESYSAQGMNVGDEAVFGELCIRGPTGQIILNAKDEPAVGVTSLPFEKQIQPSQKKKHKSTRNLWKNGKTSKAAKRYHLKRKLLALGKQPGLPSMEANQEGGQTKRMGRAPKRSTEHIPTVGTTGLSAVEIVRRNKKIKKKENEQNSICGTNKNIMKSQTENVIPPIREKNTDLVSECQTSETQSTLKSMEAAISIPVIKTFTTETQTSEQMFAMEDSGSEKPKISRQYLRLKRHEIEQIFDSSVIQQLFINTSASGMLEKKKPGRRPKSFSDEKSRTSIEYEKIINEVASYSPVLKPKLGRPFKTKVAAFEENKEKSAEQTTVMKRKPGRPPKIRCEMSMYADSSNIETMDTGLVLPSIDQMPILTLSEKRRPGRPPTRKSLPILQRETSLDRSETMSVTSSLDITDTDSLKGGSPKLLRRLSISSSRSAASTRGENSQSNFSRTYDSVINKVVEDSRQFVEKKRKYSRKLDASSKGRTFVKKTNQALSYKGKMKSKAKEKIIKPQKKMLQYKKSLQRAKAFTNLLHNDNQSALATVSVSKRKKLNKRGPLKLLRSQMMITRKGKEIKHHSGKKRKRTLSGEFDLLDEFTLRKNMRECATLPSSDSELKSYGKPNMEVGNRKKTKVRTTSSLVLEQLETNVLQGTGFGRQGFFRRPRRGGSFIQSVHRNFLAHYPSANLQLGVKNTAEPCISETKTNSDTESFNSGVSQSLTSRYHRGRSLRSRIYNRIAKRGMLKKAQIETDNLESRKESLDSVACGDAIEPRFEISTLSGQSISVVTNRRRRGRRSKMIRQSHEKPLMEVTSGNTDGTSITPAKSNRGKHRHRGRLKFLSTRTSHNDKQLQEIIKDETVKPKPKLVKRIGRRGGIRKVGRRIQKKSVLLDDTMQTLSDRFNLEDQEKMVPVSDNPPKVSASKEMTDQISVKTVNGDLGKSKYRRKSLVLKSCTAIRSSKSTSAKFHRPQRAYRGCSKRSVPFSRPLEIETDRCVMSSINTIELDIKSILDKLVYDIEKVLEPDTGLKGDEDERKETKPIKITDSNKTKDVFGPVLEISQTEDKSRKACPSTSEFSSDHSYTKSSHTVTGKEAVHILLEEIISDITNTEKSVSNDGVDNTSNVHKVQLMDDKNTVVSVLEQSSQSFNSVSAVNGSDSMKDCVKEEFVSDSMKDCVKEEFESSGVLKKSDIPTKSSVLVVNSLQAPADVEIMKDLDNTNVCEKDVRINDIMPKTDISIADSSFGLPETKMKAIHAEDVQPSIHLEKSIEDTTSFSNASTSSSPELEADFLKDNRSTEKRVFQLRQKITRSPLEIIALRQTLEEQRYFHEKMLKTQQKVSRLFGDAMKKDTKMTVSPEKINNIDEMKKRCTPCSIVLSDFVKQLKFLALQSADDTDEGSVQDDSSGVSYEMELAEESTSSGSPLPDIENETDSLADFGNTGQKAEERVGPVESPRKSLPPLKLKLKLDLSKSRKHKKKRGSQRMVYHVASTTAEDTSSMQGYEKEWEVGPDKNDVTDRQQKHEAYMKRLESSESTGFEGSFLQFIKDKDSPKKQTKEVSRETSEVSQAIENKPDENMQADTLHNNHKHSNDETSPWTETSKTEHAVPNSEEVQSAPVIKDDKKVLEQKEYTEPKLSPKSKKYHCKSCSITTDNKSEIESHIYKHLSNIPFRCGHCHRVFPSRGMAFLHSRSSHSDKETRIEKVGTVTESEHYIVMEERPEVPPKVIHTQVQKSSEPVIISVVLPQNRHESSARYCCSFCNFSSSTEDSILEHVNSNHKHETTYTCSVCNKNIFRYQESVVEHFERNHPLQQLTYKCSPDFYDLQQSSDRISQDKGNIFERMNDFFDASKDDQTPDTGARRCFPDKTSAEADSTTKETEMDENQIGDQGQEASESTTLPVTRLDRATSPGRIPFSVTSSGLQNEVLQTDVSLPHHDQQSITQKSDHPQPINMPVAPIPQPNVIILDDDKDKQSDTEGNTLELKIVDVVSLKEPVSVKATCPLVIPSVPKSHPIKPAESTLKDILSYQGSNPHMFGSLERVGTTYKCETCNIHVPVLQVMLEHLKKHHNIHSRLFQCPYCKDVAADIQIDIIKHIQETHPLQDSSVVSLSSIAKEHLKLLVIPVGDANKVGEGFLIEKDIYQCLKCQNHMPSLDFIYDHLEKEHNEVFVYVCPYCKKFKQKEEEIVFEHIKIDHKKSTSDIMLSLAIEENLFIRVPSLSRDKAYNRLLQKSITGSSSRKQATPRSLSKQHTQSRTSVNPPGSDDDIIVISDSQTSPRPPQTKTATSEKRIQLPYQHQVPGSVQSNPIHIANATVTTWYPPPAHQIQNVRSGISFHRPTFVRSKQGGLQAKSAAGHSQAFDMDSESVAGDARSTGNMGRDSNEVTDKTITKSGNDGFMKKIAPKVQTGPPPLVRGPPPLIRYDHLEKLPSVSNLTGFQKSADKPFSNVSSEGEQTTTPPVRNMSFSMTDKLHRLHSTASTVSATQLQQTPSLDTTSVQNLQTSRPVLKVPSLPSSLRTHAYQHSSSSLNKTPQINLSYSGSGSQRRSDTVQKQVPVHSPLDLSKQLPAAATPGQSSNAQVSSTSQGSAVDDNEDMPPDAFKIFNLAPSQPSMQKPHRSYTGIQSPLQELQRQVRAGFPQQMGRQVGVPQMVYNQTPVGMGRSALFPTSVQSSMRLTRPAGLQKIRPIVSDGSRPINQTNIPNRPMVNFTSMHVFKCPYCPSIVPLKMGDVAPHIEKFHPGSSIVFVSIDR